MTPKSRYDGYDWLTDACYERDITFRLKWCPNDRILQPTMIMVENTTFFLHDFCRVYIGHGVFFHLEADIFFSKWVFERGLKLHNWRAVLESNSCTSIVARFNGHSNSPGDKGTNKKLAGGCVSWRFRGAVMNCDDPAYSFFCSIISSCNCRSICYLCFVRWLTTLIKAMTTEQTMTDQSQPAQNRVEARRSLLKMRVNTQPDFCDVGVTWRHPGSKHTTDNTHIFSPTDNYWIPKLNLSIRRNV